MLASPTTAPPLAASIAARAYQAAGNEDALVQQHLPLAKTTVDRMRIYLPATLDMEDLYSVGVTGLMTAARKFDPSRNTSFPAFASLHIRGAVHDELRRMDWMPRSLRDKAKQFRDSVSALEQKLGRPPREDEVCAELSLTAEEHEALLDEIKPASFVPLDGEAYSEDSDSISLHDIISDESQPDAGSELEKKDLAQVVVARLQQLPDMQKKVLAMYYFEEMRLSEIAAAFGVTEGRISQIHTQAVQGLRAFIQRKAAGWRVGNALATARALRFGAVLHRTLRRTNLCPMKLRTDLLKHLTMEDIAEVAEASIHRFKPEPLFSKTGVGSLSPTTTEDRVQEEAHSMELTRKLEERARQAGKRDAGK